MSIAKRPIRPDAKPATLSPHYIETRRYRQLDLRLAHELLPIVRKITHKAYKELKPVQIRLNNLVPSDPRNTEVKSQYERVVHAWVGKIERLGLKVHGLWQVGFDGGTGWFGWQYPERSIRYFVEYGDYFCDRILLSDASHVEHDSKGMP